jgi:hypothetical protein
MQKKNFRIIERTIKHRSPRAVIVQIINQIAKAKGSKHSSDCIGIIALGNSLIF